MKKLLLTIALAFFPAASVTAETSFVRLSSDKQVYTVGQRAVLMAFVQTLPATSTDEIYLSARLSGDAVAITNFSTRQWVSLSPSFAVEGTEDWEVSVYLQDKILARELEATIAFYAEEIFETQQKLERETDEEKRQILLSIIARDEELIQDARNQLAQIRTLVEVKHLSIQVNPAEGVNVLAEDPLMLTLDRNPAEYPVGSRATLLTRVTKNFTGDDGAMENLIEVSLDGNPLETAVLGSKDFSTVTGVFTSEQLGTREFLVTLKIRSKAESDALRGAIAGAIKKRGAWEQELDNTTDPLMRAYIQRQIEDLNAVISGLETQLAAILTTTATKSIFLNVIP